MAGPAPIKDIVIVGGGTAGWMTAAAFARLLGIGRYTITLVESEAIGTVGVGEATVPPILLFNQGLGINERDFVERTKATFKLGIEFRGWGREKEQYFHPFGRLGNSIEGIGFPHYWMRWRAMTGADDYGLFNAETEAARAFKFAPAGQGAPDGLPKINYAYQFDAVLYATFLRTFAEKKGVRRVEGKVASVRQSPVTGHIESLFLEDGRTLSGDFFLDCTGFRGLLIEEVLKAGYADWSRWLPADRAVVVPTPRLGELPPYTRATAMPAGWQWRIPLQHRTGNGHVYASSFMDDDEAERLLLSRIEGTPTSEPGRLRFTTGMRRRGWIKNCVAIGLSGGFLEPLESTSIHLIQIAIGKLMEVFPRYTEEEDLAAQFNTAMTFHFTTIRDFLIAHYHQGERDDSPFWSYVRQYDVPDTLRARLDRFDRRGEVLTDDKEFFKDDDWFFILSGQGRLPGNIHPVAESLSDEELRFRLMRIRAGVKQRVDGLPTHDDFLAQNWP
ncbi:tryptophan halogenase family protein [Parvularcula dongshanensis]|uniref:Tryptophan halogenase n=1 Tax=Parvularcula dongshanensis TaxID=1173995 RepID=A0A840I802_9PROT|nr:tryptophan halogenase family protein [Parvularcula dongshanensis]MBB4660294.1 tryptophan halogenase [Parvularcula dongshanensis]